MAIGLGTALAIGAVSSMADDQLSMSADFMVLCGSSRASR